MQRSIRQLGRLFAVVTAAAATLALVSALALADGPIVQVSGGGVGAFDEGEEFFGLETRFAVGANVYDQPIDNQCDADLDGLGLGDFTVTDGNDFLAATGEFNCSIGVQGEGFAIIIGDVTQGRVNADGSVTLCGLAVVVDNFIGEIFVNCPFAVTLRKGIPGVGGFTYYDVLTGPPGDTETVVKGHVFVH